MAAYTNAKQSLNAEEHLQLDAGVVVKQAAENEVHKRDSPDRRPAASCAFGGYLWTLAVIGVALAVLRALRRAKI